MTNDLIAEEPDEVKVSRPVLETNGVGDNLVEFNVSRYYVQRLGGIERVQRFITISSPHQGTKVAHLSQLPGCRQMRPSSSLIQDLNQDIEMLEQIKFTSIWTPFDLMIVPAKSSRLPVGREVVLPVAAHAWMLTDSRSIQAVVTALSEPLKHPAAQASTASPI